MVWDGEGRARGGVVVGDGEGGKGSGAGRRREVGREDGVRGGGRWGVGIEGGWGVVRGLGARGGWGGVGESERWRGGDVAGMSVFVRPPDSCTQGLPSSLRTAVHGQRLGAGSRL